ncbi:LLM class flavin-dependent oxidoreductase [Leucobacter celer]|jgi:FMN-dependent oxidoreductase (nitrilotriacetate monooxygenase family)|uniref:LLM class flavin-dependent oxidoreductase n=1 Tax=Leucobacter celer TaxID=668625 RepID=UPI0006A7E7F5|nr:LLM class flavin-dependent oxidoreductase [Leucobacter celer]
MSTEQRAEPSAEQRIHLNLFTMNTVGHLSPGLWRHPADQSRRYTELPYWLDIARTAEAGLLDAIFFADVLGTYDVYGGGPEAALAGGVQVPVNDPLQLVPALASVTEHIGFGVTASTSFEHPFPFARRMSTLDHLTGGRVGWNVVTSYLGSGARNLGLEGQVSHDRRYDIAEEYLEVCYKLWQRSWDDDAIVADAATGVFADPERVHSIGHRGEFFTVPGFHLSEPSPQRTPVIYQAGASSRGVSFAARHAEHVFVAAPTRTVLKKQVRAVREAAAEAGRAQTPPVLNQLTVIVSDTDAHARQLFEEYLEVASPEGALTLMSGWTGIDFAKLDPDAPLAGHSSNAIQSALAAFTDADPDRVWTPREIADYARIGGDGPVIVGSAGTVADTIEEIVEETGVSGFNLAAVSQPETLRGIVEHLVPELQTRGRFKRGYESGTLREKLGGSDARPGADHPASQVRIDGA